LGITYLTSAGYYPGAMIDFLKIMKQYEFISKTMPSYLMTHPGTDQRIFYLDSLILTSYRQTGAKNIVGNLKRLQTLISLNEADLDARQRQLKDALIKNPRNVDVLYALALVEDKLGQTSLALEHFQKALSLSPRDEEILKNIGLKNVRINIGNLTIINTIFKRFNLPEDDQKRLLPLIDKSQFDDLKASLQDCGVCEADVEQFIRVLQTSEVNEIRSFIADDPDAIKELSIIETIIGLLKNAFYITEYDIKLSIVRGLDYYKGLVFEIDAPVLGAEKQLCGGGSYDLVTLFGGTEV